MHIVDSEGLIGRFPLSMDNGRGFVLCMAEMLGRDASGMAGGSDITDTLSECTRLVTGR
jgi:hypothetical protein